jgi:hypothetical protein
MSEHSAMRWQLRAYGSALFGWDVARGPIAVPTSYVGDALADLIQVASDLKLGSSATFMHFLGEPGGYRMFFSGAAEEVFVQLVQFDDLQSETERWKGGVLVWAGRVGTNEFINSVRSMSELVLQEIGLKGYRKAWGRPFPVQALEALRALFE